MSAPVGDRSTTRTGSDSWERVAKVEEGLFAVDGTLHLHPEEFLRWRGHRPTRKAQARLVNEMRGMARKVGATLHVFHEEEGS